MSSSSSSLASPPIADEKNSLFFLCDIQETFRDKIVNWRELVSVAVFMSRVSTTLEIPLIVTEQKPFKPTVAEVAVSSLPNARLFSKSRFSMMTDEVQAAIGRLEGDLGRKFANIFLFGLETHVCVLQTVLDLNRLGYRVYLVSDGIGSQRLSDMLPALQRMSKLNEVLTTTAESSVYELMKDAQHPKFKACLPHVKDLAAGKAHSAKL